MNNPFLEAVVTKADAEKFAEIAATWNILQNHLRVLSEKDLAKLLRWELDNQRRAYVINRIKAQHDRLRDARERHEMMQ